MTSNSSQKPRRSPKISISRKVAVEAFRAVLEKQQTLENAITESANREKLDSRDRAFVVQLTSTALRRYGSLIGTLDFMMEKPFKENATDVRAVILLGMTQIFFMRTDDHAAVNESVNLLYGKRERYRGIANAILRRSIRERDEILSHMESTPEEDLPHWIASSWTQTYGAEIVAKIAQCLRHPPKIDLTVKNDADRDDLALELEAKIMPTGNLRIDPTDVSKLSGYDQGAWWVQDLATSIPATLLGDIKGKTVVDFCAAPGGKTMQLAAAGAQVIAVDRSKPRLKRLHANMKRTWLKAKVITDDALTVDLSDYEIDHILLDAPCTATGTLRRNPDMMWCKDPEDVIKLAGLQKRMLKRSFDLLPVGGTLIYCVCSLEAPESIDPITDFLSRTKTAERRPITSSEVGGLKELITEDGDLLCLPHYLSDEGGMDGFYAARLTKTA
ncbi:transcription antitermination factor NusB [Temperatibacter marinus]|uniref:Transcription antitermination factor NusB n=1 Tax=Temperatibacter marinus TaxID=1456591 RepID=A0AA52HAM1_9PROT|nr:transcription antitermination factor NusB [Temperatibacter marinus]WND04119.1 transcription antitermination factor NusB [Temperatibacter marinus]